MSAAAAVLMSDGVGGFTMDKVIARSGVSSATVFKHWPSRGALALQAYVHTVGEGIAARDTGDIRADLKHMIIAFVEMVTRSPEGKVFAQLIGAAQTDDELAAQFDHHYFGPRRREAFALVERAKERGQITPNADIGFLVDAIWGPCYIRLLLPHLTSKLTVEFAESAVDQALLGVAIGTA